MKTRTWNYVVLLACGLSILTALTAAQNSNPSAVKDFMRQKLGYSQKVLEGLATEDFDLIAANAQKMSAMSEAPTWQVVKNPAYVEHSVEFRRNVDALTKEGRERNIDGATLAYMRVTMSCVNCHKFVRGRKVASIKW